MERQKARDLEDPLLLDHLDQMAHKTYIDEILETCTEALSAVRRYRKALEKEEARRADTHTDNNNLSHL